MVDTNAANKWLLGGGHRTLTFYQTRDTTEVIDLNEYFDKYI